MEGWDMEVEVEGEEFSLFLFLFCCFVIDVWLLGLGLPRMRKLMEAPIPGRSVY